MIDEFKSDLSTHSSKQLVRKYVLNGSCQILNEEKHYQLKQEICENFKIDFADVLLVGSGKLGFSIKPSKRYVLFGNDSDIDIAVVSTKLFQKVWEEVYLHQKGGAYWPSRDDFSKYLFKGWIRPDKLPSSSSFEFSSSWWSFFNSITSSEIYGPYKIRAGLYHSWFFLEEYQKICVDQCIEESLK